MENLQIAIDLFVHLDAYLENFIDLYGEWVYPLTFFIVFLETGFVLTPFLPGDSLLFVLGAIAATGGLNIHLAAALLIIAAILGDTLNYSLGNYLGPKVFSNQNSKLFNPMYLSKTQLFFKKHGGKAVVLARFIPILRTYAPFVAGCGSMRYQSFIFYNIFGAILWVGSIGYAGYFFGGIPLVKNNISIFILGIVFLSVSPIILNLLRSRQQKT